jgi:hypothetical protein
MNKRDKPFRYGLVPEEKQDNTKYAIKYLQEELLSTIRELRALNLQNVELNPSLEAYETFKCAKELFRNRHKTLAFLDKYKEQILMLITSGKIPKLVPQNEVQTDDV